MTIIELAFSFAVVLLVFAGFVGLQRDQHLDIEAQTVASVVRSVHEATESYLREEHPRLSQCFDLPHLLELWAHDPDGGQSTPFLPVPLYDPEPGEALVNHLGIAAGGSFEFAPSSPAEGHHPFDVATGPYQATPDVCPNRTRLDPATGNVIDIPGLRSLASAGLLPASLSALSYGPADQQLWGPRQVDIRVLVRVLNANHSAAPGHAAALQYQALLVLRAHRAQPFSPAFASRVAQLVGRPEAGVLSSLDRPGPYRLSGVAGGWALSLCTAEAPVLGSAPWAPGDLPLCPSHQTAAPANGTYEYPDVGWLPLYEASRDALTAALFLPPEAGVVPGFTGRNDDPAAALVVALVRHTPRSAVEQALHRDDIGIPRLNRMATHIDMGGFGLANTAFVSTLDLDGDGSLDQRLHILGHEREFADARDAPPAFPIVLHGDVHVTGALHVAGTRVGARNPLTGAVVTAGEAAPPAPFDHRLRPGDMRVDGAVVVGRVSDPRGAAGLAGVALATEARDEWHVPVFPAGHPQADEPVLQPGDLRVRNVAEVQNRLFAWRGLEAIGGRIVLAPGVQDSGDDDYFDCPTASCAGPAGAPLPTGLPGGDPDLPVYFRRAQVLQALAERRKVGIDSTRSGYSAAGLRDDLTVSGSADLGRGRDSDLYVSVPTGLMSSFARYHSLRAIRINEILSSGGTVLRTGWVPYEGVYSMSDFSSFYDTGYAHPDSISPGAVPVAEGGYGTGVLALPMAPATFALLHENPGSPVASTLWGSNLSPLDIDSPGPIDVQGRPLRPTGDSRVPGDQHPVLGSVPDDEAGFVPRFRGLILDPDRVMLRMSSSRRARFLSDRYLLLPGQGSTPFRNAPPDQPNSLLGPRFNFGSNPLDVTSRLLSQALPSHVLVHWESSHGLTAGPVDPDPGRFATRAGGAVRCPPGSRLIATSTSGLPVARQDPRFWVEGPGPITIPSGWAMSAIPDVLRRDFDLPTFQVGIPEFNARLQLPHQQGAAHTFRNLMVSATARVQNARHGHTSAPDGRVNIGDTTIRFSTHGHGVADVTHDHGQPLADHVAQLVIPEATTPPIQLETEDTLMQLGWSVDPRTGINNALLGPDPANDRFQDHVSVAGNPLTQPFTRYTILYHCTFQLNPRIDGG